MKRIFFAIIAAVAISRLGSERLAHAQSRADSLEIAVTIAKRALPDARKQWAQTNRLVIPHADRCPTCLDLRALLSDSIVVKRDSLPLCPWRQASSDAGLAVMVSDLVIHSDSASAEVSLRCTGGQPKARGFRWVFRYILVRSFGQWLVRDVIPVSIT